MLLATVFAASAAAAAPADLRVMTYNIHGGAGASVPHLGPIPFPVARGTAALDRICDLIVRERIDIACLQEVKDTSLTSVMVDQGAHMANRLEYHKLYVVSSKRWFGALQRIGNCLLTRWPILEHRLIDLPPEDTETARSAIVARVKVPGTRRGVWVIATHLHAGTGRANTSMRHRELAVLEPILSSLAGPVVFAGDLNSRVDSPIIARLKTLANSEGAHLADTGGPEGGNTYPWFGPAIRIDWILATTDLTVISARVLTGCRESDHLPVVATFSLPGSATLGRGPVRLLGVAATE